VRTKGTSGAAYTSRSEHTKCCSMKDRIYVSNPDL
jgi:hypothetical protein